MEITVRGLKIGEGSPKICVPLMGETREEILSEAKRITGFSPDLIEWRADCLADEPDEDIHIGLLAEIREAVGEIPVIYTFRTDEGGGKEISESKYEELVTSVAKEGKCDLIDIEVFFLKMKARAVIDEIHSFSDAKVIGSYHDMTTTPDTAELIYRFSVIDHCNVDILKIATMPKKKKDVMRIMTATVLTCTRPDPKPIISVAMGKLGRITRFLGGFTGSAITFAEAGRESAPGQIEITELRKLIESVEKVL